MSSLFVTCWYSLTRCFHCCLSCDRVIVVFILIGVGPLDHESLLLWLATSRFAYCMLHGVPYGFYGTFPFSIYFNKVGVIIQISDNPGLVQLKYFWQAAQIFLAGKFYWRILTSLTPTEITNTHWHIWHHWLLLTQLTPTDTTTTDTNWHH